jgi:acetyl esterase/lipase
VRSTLDYSWRLLARLLMYAVIMVQPACHVSDIPIWSRPGDRSASPYQVEKSSNITYCDEASTDDYRHMLDVYVPKGLKDYPVVMLVYGGAWVMGDFHCCGLYPAVAEFLASQGLGVVVPNYRLSPDVQHPEHIKDVARAFAWTHAHIAQRGGDPNQIFVMGHSAGGHLAALLATNEKYLAVHGLSSANIKGVIGVSGVYDIPPGPVVGRLGGTESGSFRFDQLYPIRGASRFRGPLSWLPGIPLEVDVFGPSFGHDLATRDDASPLKHVHPGLPPFLLLCADNDLPTIAPGAQKFYAALRDQGVPAALLIATNRNHDTVMFTAVEAMDPAAGAMLDFIRANSQPRREQPIPE